MNMVKRAFTCIFILGVTLAGTPRSALAQQSESVKKQLQISPKIANDHDSSFRLLASEEEQEQGNAVPVLLRMVYEQQPFMKDLYPRLHEFAEMDNSDPKWKDFYFDLFAEHIIRSGSMSHADWQYPLRSERPYLILLPDMQSQRQLVGKGMTAWIRQQLAQGKTDKALQGIKAQFGCSRHCAATPIVICHLVGLAIANSGFDNLELVIQAGECPNMYWALATLPPTLQDLGPMVRWELSATPTRLSEPLPSIGNDQWIQISNRFIDLFSEASNIRYTREEGEALQKKMDLLSKDQLEKEFGFAVEDVERMMKEERIMRWLYLHYLRFRSNVEPLAYQSPKQIIAAKRTIEANNEKLLRESGAKSSPYPVMLPHGVLACRNFERRAKFLQTIEAIRDYAGRNNGTLPAKLDDLHLAAPKDPFTEQPFDYELRGKTARLSQAKIDGFSGVTCDYELTAK